MFEKGYEQGEFDDMNPYQIVDFCDVFQGLENNPTEEGKLDLLDKKYPILYLWLLKRKGMNKAADKYLEGNKNHNNQSRENFYRYLHGYCLPLVLERKQKGQLKTGKFC